MPFEWDPTKDRINQAKHTGLDFETAARVFDDPNVLAALLLVVHVYREDDGNGEEIIRILSAREANQRERRIYIEQAPQ